MRDVSQQVERAFGVERDELPEPLCRLIDEYQREHEAESERRNGGNLDVW